MHNNTLPKQKNILKVTSAPKPKGVNTAGTNKPIWTDEDWLKTHGTDVPAAIPEES